MDRGISIIAIGDEVLHGVTLNTNSTYIADALFQRGYLPVSHSVTSDSPEDIARVIIQELRARRDVIATGGLGPTSDDNTKAVAAELFSRPLIRDDTLFKELGRRYGEQFPTLEHQSLQPQGARIFRNTVGAAPGILLEDKQLFPGARLFILPGPPHEMKDVLVSEILPQFFPQRATQCRVFRFLGLSEYEIDSFLRVLQEQHPQLHVGIYPSYQIVRVHLSVLDPNEEPVLENAAAAVQSAFRQYLLSESDTTLEGVVHALLRKRGWKIATAESCTGGAVAARLTSLPGSSDVVSGSVVAYQNEVKESVLAVPLDVLRQHGAVSTEVTEYMARGVKALFGVQVVCAVSGFFGPDGGTQEAPVGTVCASFLMPNNEVSECFFFHGTREAICEKTIQALLAKLIMLLRGAPAP